MRIWLTGKKGLLGSWFLEILQKNNYDFIATDKKDIDLTKAIAVQNFVSIHKPTHIINCAAYTEVVRAEKERLESFAVNYVAVKNLACFTRGCKVIHFSTDYVFDGITTKPYKENNCAFPLNVYGKSKLAGENILFFFKKNALCLRLSWLYGRDKDFVSKIYTQTQGKNRLCVIVDQIGTPTFAKDVVLTTLQIIDRQGLYHFSNEGYCSWYDFARQIVQDKKVQIDPVLSKNFSVKVKRPLYSVFDLSKIQQVGIKIRPWKIALEEYLNEK